MLLLFKNFKNFCAVIIRLVLLGTQDTGTPVVLVETDKMEEKKGQTFYQVKLIQMRLLKK